MPAAHQPRRLDCSRCALAGAPSAGFSAFLHPILFASDSVLDVRLGRGGRTVALVHCGRCLCFRAVDGAVAWPSFVSANAGPGLTHARHGKLRRALAPRALYRERIRGACVVDRQLQHDVLLDRLRARCAVSHCVHRRLLHASESLGSSRCPLRKTGRNSIHGKYGASRAMGSLAGRDPVLGVHQPRAVRTLAGARRFSMAAGVLRRECRRGMAFRAASLVRTR